MASLESEKLGLECEKLRVEIAGLKSPRSFSSKVSQHSVLVSMVVALLGFGFGIYQYREQQEENRRAAEVESRKERDAASERALQVLLAELPLGFRDVVVLREIEGCSYKEIAAILGVPIGTVMSRLARGREELRKALTRRSTEDKQNAM